MPKLNYFIIQYHYKSATRGICHSDARGMVHIAFNVDEKEEDKRLTEAYHRSIEVEAKLRLHTHPEYAWPDGSLFNQVLTEMTKEELQALLDVYATPDFRLEVHDTSRPECKHCPYTFDEDGHPSKIKRNVSIKHDNYAIECQNPGVGKEHVAFFEIPKTKKQKADEEERREESRILKSVYRKAKENERRACRRMINVPH